MSRRACLKLLACAALPLGAACKMPETPGDLVGAYAITGELMENTCGSAAVPAADPLRFEVEVRSDEGSGWWVVAEPPAHQGTLRRDGRFSFELEQAFDVTGPGAEAQPPELITEMQIEELADPERYAQAGGAPEQRCRLSIRERVSGRVLRDGRADGGIDERSDAAADDGDEPEADLIGENEISLRAASGSACEIVLEQNGGPFEELPCRVRYELEGTLLDRDE